MARGNRRRISPHSRRVTNARRIPFVVTNLTFSDEITGHEYAVLTDTIEWSDSIAGNLGDTLTDRIEWSDDLTASFDVTETLADTINWSDTIDGAISDTLADTVEWSDVLTSKESATLVDTVNWSDAITFDFDVEGASTITINWSDTIDGVVSGAFDGATYAFNANTAAASQYSNWSFDSIATIDGITYAVNGTSLYQITGSTDAGTDIDVVIRTGITDFGTPQLKRMDDAIFGIKANDQAIVKARVVNDGVMDEHHYVTSTQPNSAIRERRVRFGKGLKSVYWQFEINNQDGGDIEMDRISIYPIILDRRRAA